MHRLPELPYEKQETASRSLFPALSSDLLNRTLQHAPVQANARDNTVNIETTENLTCVLGSCTPGGLLWCRPAVSLCDDQRKRSIDNSDENITKEIYSSHDLLLAAVRHQWTESGFRFDAPHSSAEPSAVLLKKASSMFCQEAVRGNCSPTAQMTNEWNVCGVLISAQASTFSYSGDIAMGNLSRKILGPVVFENSSRFNVAADCFVDLDNLIAERAARGAYFPFWATRAFDSISRTQSNETNHRAAKFYVVAYDVPSSIPSMFESGPRNDEQSEQRTMLSVAVARSVAYTMDAILTDIKKEISQNYSENETGIYIVACQEIGVAMPVSLNRSRSRIVSGSNGVRRLVVDDFRIDVSKSTWKHALIKADLRVEASNDRITQTHGDNSEKEINLGSV